MFEHVLIAIIVLAAFGHLLWRYLPRRRARGTARDAGCATGCGGCGGCPAAGKKAPRHIP